MLVDGPDELKTLAEVCLLCSNYREDLCVCYRCAECIKMDGHAKTCRRRLEAGNGDAPSGR